MVTIRRLHDILGFLPFDYEPINDFINSKTLSKLFEVHIDMSIIGNENYWAKLGRQGSRRRVHRTLAVSDHLRWSPNFYTTTSTSPEPFFKTRPKSNSGRKGPEISPKADRNPPRDFPIDLRRPAVSGGGAGGAGLVAAWASKPSKVSGQPWPETAPVITPPISRFSA